MKKKLLLYFLISFSLRAYTQTSYVCFENDKNKKLRLWVFFDKKEKAKYVKYDGQNDSIKLTFSHINKYENKGGGIPAVYWDETYVEKYQGKITGKYTLTNAGTHGLDISYTRKKDNKEFYFQVIESSFDEVSGIYKDKPCF